MQYNFCLYIRVSTDEQDPLAQKLEAEKFVRSNPQFNITAVYEERCSAWSQVPDSLVQMIKDIESHPVGQRPNILVKCVDRFSRNIQYGTECLEKILSLGIEIMFFDYPRLNVRTPEGRAFFDEALRVAQGYSDAQSAKIKDALEARRQNGLATTGSPIFGTIHVEGNDGRKYVQDCPEEIMIQALIAMLNGYYTNNDIMRGVRVYQASFGNPTFTRSMYDHDFVPFKDRHELFVGSDRTFAEVLNYFQVWKRGDAWTAGSIKYQWDRYVQPKAEFFERYIEKNIMCHVVPEHLLVPINGNCRNISSSSDSSSSCSDTTSETESLESALESVLSSEF